MTQPTVSTLRGTIDKATQTIDKAKSSASDTAARLAQPAGTTAEATRPASGA